MNRKAHITLALLCTAFTASAQVFYKFGVPTTAWTLTTFLINPWLWAGFASYGLGALLLLYLLKRGSLSTTFPILSSSYIWVAILSSFFFGEIISFPKIGGIALIIGGIILSEAYHD